MRICVIGCGAMGSIYAALLSSSGNDVTVVDTNQKHIDAINSKGLRVWGASGDRTVKLSARTEAFDLAPEDRPDLLICAVKARFVADAVGTLQRMTGPHTHVLTIQNGLGSAQAIAEKVAPDRLIIGIAQGFGASLPTPGCAHHNSMKAIRIGAYAGLNPDTVTRIAELWTDAGLDTQAVADIASMQWSKLICNVAYSGPCAISGLTVGEVLKHPQLTILSQAAAREAYLVAVKLGIALPFTDVEQQVRDFAAGMPDAKPSVLLDIERGALSEIDVINGAIPREAHKVGLAAPVNEAVTTLVRQIEDRFKRQP